jgi:hypothetical protein
VGSGDAAATALDDLWYLNTTGVRPEWHELKSTQTANWPSARYGMGFAMASSGKFYVVGGRLSAWTIGESRYSWSDNAALNADYGAAKGNDDIWELELREIVLSTGAKTEPNWIRRAISLYASLCSDEWTIGEWLCRLYVL